MHLVTSLCVIIANSNIANSNICVNDHVMICIISSCLGVTAWTGLCDVQVVLLGRPFGNPGVAGYARHVLGGCCHSKSFATRSASLLMCLFCCLLGLMYPRLITCFFCCLFGPIYLRRIGAWVSSYTSVQLLRYLLAWYREGAV